MIAFCNVKILAAVLGISWIVLKPGGAYGQLIFGPPVNAGPGINSNSGDGGAAVSVDGLEVFFGSDRPDSPGHGYFDVFTAKRESLDDQFGPATRLGPPISVFGSTEGEMSLSADFSDRNRAETRPPRPGGLGSADIWVAGRDSVVSEFSDVTNLGSPINSEFYDAGPSLSRDGLSLFFSSKRPGGEGRADIWVATREYVGDAWQEPIHLGDALNSPVDDLRPAVSLDGNWLAFARDACSILNVARP